MEDFLKRCNKEKICTFSDLLNSQSPIEFITTGYIISIILCEIIPPPQQNTLGNFLEMVGQILLTSYAQASTINPNYTPPSLTDFNNLQNQVNSIKKFILNNSVINTHNNSATKEHK